MGETDKYFGVSLDTWSNSSDRQRAGLVASMMALGQGGEIVTLELLRVMGQPVPTVAEIRDFAVQVLGVEIPQ